MENRGSLKIIAGACLFGLIPVFVRFGDELSVFSIALGRAIFATLFARIYLGFKNENVSLQFKNFNSVVFLHFFIWSVFLTFAILFYFLSIQYGSVALSGVLLGVHPVFVVFFVFVFFKEKISGKTLFSCFLAIVGILLISGIQNGMPEKLAGSLYALVSAFFLGLNFTYYLKYLKDYSAGKLVYYQNILQILILIPFAFSNPGIINLNGIISVICLGVFCTGIAYFLIYSGSQFVKKQKIGILQIIENIIPIIIGVAFYHEQIAIISIFGILLILFSVILISFEVE